MDSVNRFAGVVRDPAGSSHGVLVPFFKLFWQWRERSRQRRALLELDDRLLSDIGIGRAEAEREAVRPFWDPWTDHDAPRDRHRN